MSTAPHVRPFLTPILRSIAAKSPARQAACKHLKNLTSLLYEKIKIFFIYNIISAIFVVFCQAQQSHPVNEEPVILPEYKVTLSRLDIENEPWLYTAWNDIEIISSTDYETTDEFLKEMRRFLCAYEAATPGLRPRSMLPFGIILHGSGPTRKQLYLQNWNPALPKRGEQGSRTFIAEQGGRQIIGIQADPKSDKSNRTLGPTEQRGTGTATHYFFNRLEQYYPPLPRWYVVTIREITRESGLKDFKNFDSGTYIIGNLDWVVSEWQYTVQEDDHMKLWRGQFTGRSTPIANHVGSGGPSGGTATKIPSKSESDIFSFSNWDAAVRHEKMKGKVQEKPTEKQRIRPMPMARMFAGTYDDLVRTPGYPAKLWQTQCYTFWHYCCARSDAGPLKRGYFKLVEKSGDGPITEEVFRECMGMGFADMEKALFQYVGSERAKQGYDKLEIPFVVGTFPHEVPLRKATQAEIARIKGECLAFQGKLDLARKTMLSVYDRKKADPALCAALGVLEYKAGDLEKARLLLAAAIQLKLPNPEVYRTLARIKLDDALGMKKDQKPAPDKRLTPDQASEIYTLLQTMRRMPPIRVETYELLNELLSHANMPPTPEQKAFVEEGKRWFPDGKNPKDYPWDEITAASRSRSKPRRI